MYRIPRGCQISPLVVFMLVISLPAPGMGQSSPQHEGHPKPHVKQMRDAITPALPTELSHRLYDRLFDVEEEIRTTRMIIRRIRSVALHKTLTEDEADRLDLHREMVLVLETAKSSLAKLHVQVAECTAECARAESGAKPADDTSGPAEHLERMTSRMSSAHEAHRELDESIRKMMDVAAKLEGVSVDQLKQRRAEARKRADQYYELDDSIERAAMVRAILRDDRQLRLIEYLSNESRYLGNAIDACRSVVTDAPEPEEEDH